VSGIYVKNLFKILRLFEVPQTVVCQRLGVAKPTVSAWATGRRPMPGRYYGRFFALVSQTFDDVMSRLSRDKRVYEAAMAQVQAAQDPIPWGAFSPEQQEVLRREIGTELDDVGSEVAPYVALSRLGCDDTQRHLLKQVAQLLTEWQLEAQQAMLYREIWEHCRLVVAYGQLDFDAFWQRVSSRPEEREALQRAADTIAKRTRRLERVAAPPGIERLWAQVEAWQTSAAQTQAAVEPDEGRRRSPSKGGK